MAAPLMAAPMDYQSEPVRCGWASGELSVRYLDAEWGVPVHDERTLFEFLILEGAQAGLSWNTILNKRNNYRTAFAGFDPGKSRATIVARSNNSCAIPA